MHKLIKKKDYMNPQEPTTSNIQSNDQATQKSVDTNQATQQSTTTPASQSTMPSQTTVNTDSMTAINQTKKSPVLNKGVLVGLIVLVILLAAGGIYWFYTMQQ